MIYLIITTSIIDKRNRFDVRRRKERYSECINAVLTLIEESVGEEIKPIIVENNNSYCFPEFDGFKNCDVVYTNNNHHICSHKGVNELEDIKFIINKYNIADDDMVIKLTGRYKLLWAEFLNLVKNGVGEQYDAYIKFFNVCSLMYHPNDCVLGMFAIKCRYLKELQYNCKKSPECEFADFVRTRIDATRIMNMIDLNLECCFADGLRILRV